MRLLLVVLLVPFASGRQSSYGVDEDILDEVFDQLQYDDNYDYDVAVEDVNYDYAYEDADQATIPGKAGRDYPIYVDIPRTSFNCKGDYKYQRKITNLILIVM